jgi:hypothetical protein
MDMENTLEAHTENTNHLIEEADRFYEEENYAAAFELYREVVMQGPPTRHAVGFLHISLERMGPDLMHQLLYKYPESFAVREQAAIYFQNKSPSDISVRLCTELIEENRQAGDTYDPALERYLRGVRLQAAVYWPLSPATSQEYQFFIQDFSQLWATSTARRWLLDAITRIWDPLFIPALGSLAEAEDLPLPVRHLLAAKTVELQALREANEALNETPI